MLRLALRRAWPSEAALSVRAFHHYNNQQSYTQQGTNNGRSGNYNRNQNENYANQHQNHTGGGNSSSQFYRSGQRQHQQQDNRSHTNYNNSGGNRPHGNKLSHNSNTGGDNANRQYQARSDKSGQHQRPPGTAALQGTTSKPFTHAQIKDRDPIGGAHMIQKLFPRPNPSVQSTSTTPTGKPSAPRIPPNHHSLAVLVDVDAISAKDFLQSITPIIAKQCGALTAEFAGNKLRAARAPAYMKAHELPLEITSSLHPPTDSLQQAGIAYFPSLFGRGESAEEDIDKKSIPATLARHLSDQQGAVCLLRCYGHGRLSQGWLKCLTAIGTEVQTRKKQLLDAPAESEATTKLEPIFMLPSTPLALSSCASIEYFQVDEFLPTAMQITAEIGHLLHHSPTNLLTGIVTCVGKEDRAGFLYECMRHQRHSVSQYIVTKEKLEGTSFGPLFTNDD